MLSFDLIINIIKYNLLKNNFNITIKKDIKYEFNIILNYCLISKNIYNKLNEYYNKYKNIYTLMNKYDIYQKDYERYIKNKHIYSIGSPQLYDLISTGCSIPYIKSSHKVWNKNIENDLYNILKSFPTCMNFNKGYLKNREKVPILFIACINENIPIKFIKILLNNGSSWNEYVLLNSRKISIIEDLRMNLSVNRYDLIKQICYKL